MSKTGRSQNPNSPRKQVLEFSRENLLITDPFVPMLYNVRLIKAPKANVLVKVEIVNSAHEDSIPFRIEPSVMTFDPITYDLFQEIKICVELSCPLDSAMNLKSQYQVRHVVISPEEEFQNISKIIDLYFLETFGQTIMGCGKDDFCQVGMYDAIYRFKAYKELSSITLTKPLKSKVAKFSESFFQNQNKNDLKFRCLDMGKEHTIAVTKSGECYSWGTGIYGQLGLTLDEIVKSQNEALGTDFQNIKYDFKKVELKDQERFYQQNGFTPFVYLPVKVKLNKKIIAVACGHYHTILLDVIGRLYAMGCGKNGRLGTGYNDNYATPQQVKTEVFFVKVACTAHSNLAIDTTGTLYTWGCANDGVLGLGETKDITVPTAIDGLDGVSSIVCGPKTCSVLHSNGQMYVWGEFNRNKFNIPRKYHPFEDSDVSIKTVAIGSDHYGVITEDLDVYMWGNNEHGQLGLASDDAEIRTPSLVLGLRGLGVCQLSLGDNHSAAITVQGFIYTWGKNNKIQLGLNDCFEDNMIYKTQEDENQMNKSVMFPKMVEYLIGKPVVWVKCGFENTLIIHDEFPKGQVEVEYDTLEFVDKWKEAIIRKENKLVGVRAKDKMRQNEKSGPSLEELRKRHPPKVHKYEPKDDDGGDGGKFSSRKNENVEPKCFYEVTDENPILFQLLGQGKSTIFENRIYPKPEEFEEKVEAMQITDKNSGCIGVPQEIIDYNYKKFPQLKLFYTNQVFRRKENLADILVPDEFDEVQKLIEDRTRKNPFMITLKKTNI